MMKNNLMTNQEGLCTGPIGIEKGEFCTGGRSWSWPAQTLRRFCHFIVVEFLREIPLTQKRVHVKLMLPQILSELWNLHSCESFSHLKSLVRSRPAGYFEKALRRSCSAKAFGCHWGTSEQWHPRKSSATSRGIFLYT